MKKITDNFYVAGQIKDRDFSAITAAGIKTIINNRPEGEGLFQPKSAELAAKAAEVGMTYHHIPVANGQIAPGQITAFKSVLDGSDGAVLAFCRSGTRSSILWAIALAPYLEIDDILAKTGAAGYNFQGYRPMLESLRTA